jgi:hypothetical protein
MANKNGISKPSIEEHLRECGVSRRSFLQLCTSLMVTAPVGLALTQKATALQVAAALGKAKGLPSSGFTSRTAPGVRKRC